MSQASQAPAPVWGAAPSTIGSGTQFSVAFPQVTMAADGIHGVALWLVGKTLRVKSGVMVGTTMTWGDPFVLQGSEAKAPSVAISADGASAIATWTEFDGTRGYVSVGRLSGTLTQWSPAELIPLNGGFLTSGIPVSVSDDGSRVTMAWVQSDESAHVYSRSGTVGGTSVTWSAPVSLSSGDSSPSAVRLALASDGSVAAVAYLRDSYSTPSIRVKIATISGETPTVTWTGRILASSGGAVASPYAMVLSGDGSRLVFAWSTAASPGTVWTRVASLTGNASTWGDSFIHPSAAEALNPTLAVSGDGSDAILAWQGMSGGQTSMNDAVMAQSATIEGATATWDDSTVLVAEPLATLGSVAMSRDGTRVAASWSTAASGVGSGSLSIGRVPAGAPSPSRFNTSTHELVVHGEVSSMGIEWGTAQYVSDDTTLAGPPNAGQNLSMSSDGTRLLASWVENTQEPSSLFANTGLWGAPAPEPPPTPAPVVPPTPPMSAHAVMHNGVAEVTWLPPQQSGSFPVTNYRVTSSPGGRTCLTSGLTCTFGGLTMGTTYVFGVSALSGAGWGQEAWTEPVTAVSVVIVGARSRGRVTIVGHASPGDVISVWTRIGDTSSFAPAPKAVVADAVGRFDWGRKVRREISVYAVSGSNQSNTVVLPRD